MRNRSNEQSRVIKPFLTTAIPPRASAHSGKHMKIRSYHSSPAYDLADIDTVPPSANVDISALDTVEQPSRRENTIVSPRLYARETPIPPSTALPNAIKDNARLNSTYTQYMAGAKKISMSPVMPSPKEYEYSHKSLRLSLLERVRWWLLYPGRIEFLIWSGGTLLLLFITVVLVMMTMLSLHIFD